MKTLHRLTGTALLIVVAGVTYACADFLEGPPQGALDEGTLANAAGVEASLISTYRMLDAGGPVTAMEHAASNWIWGSVTSDDASKGTEASDFPSITDVELYNWGTSSAEGAIGVRWNGLYEGINRANSTIKLLDAVLASDNNDITPAQADRIRGEAIFLRAHFHFEAYRMWGGIPYYTEADTTFRKAQLSEAASLAAVIADLTTAIGLLPPTQAQVGRATQWTARAYLGKAQIYAEDWAAARTTLGQVVNSGPYDLESDWSRVYTGYNALENGDETILAYQASANDGAPSGNNANYGERLNFPHSGSPFGCCGFHQPTHNLVNFFQVDAAGLPLAMTATPWNTFGTNLNATATDRATSGILMDPRLDWTVGRDGVPYKDWGLHQPGWIRQVSYGGPYSPKKSAYESGSGAMSSVGWVNTQLSSMNMHILRYGEVLLLLAEAEVEGGSLNTACQLVNQIRTRAGAAAQGPVGGPLAVPINAAAITWADYRIGTYPCPFASATYARDAVRTEQRLEMAMEGQRFFNLRRWGLAETTLNGFLATETPRRPYLSGASSFQARHLLFPIPAVQIELSEVDGAPTLTQNSGW